MKKLLSVMLVLAMVLCLGACSNQAEESAEVAEESAEPILIGTIQDISSTTSVMGMMIEAGIEWQVETINATGGINGRQIELVKRDSKANVDESIKAYQECVDLGCVAVIGPHQANIGIALAPIAEETGTPILCMGMDNRVTRQGDDGFGDPWTYMFLSQPSCDLQGAMQAKFALDQGWTKFAVLYNTENSYSYSLYYAFKAYVEANGGEIVAVESFVSADTDYSTQLTKLINAGGFDALFSPNYTGQLVTITNQARQLGWTGPMINGLDSAPPFNTMCEGSNADGVYFVSNIDLNDERVVAVVEAMQEATGNTEPNQINKFCVGYDMAGMLATVIADKGTDADAICDGLANLTNYDGLTGNITIDPDTHQPTGYPMIMHVIENGENVPVAEVVADVVAYN